MTPEELRNFAQNGYHPTKPMGWADVMRAAADRIESLQRQVADLNAAIESFRNYCQTSCDARSCDAWRDRGRRCPECPLDHWDELDSRLRPQATIADVRPEGFIWDQRAE